MITRANPSGWDAASILWYQNEIRDNRGEIMRQLAGGPIKICSGRIGGKVSFTVVGYRLGGKNSEGRFA